MTGDDERNERRLDPDATPIQRALHSRREGTPSANPTLAPEDQQLVDDVLPWLDAIHEAALHTVVELQSDAQPSGRVPVRADDPVALMLGLVPDPALVVSGSKLAAARKRARLNLQQLVDRLLARGWDLSLQKCFRWELGHPELSPALITAIAEELSVNDDALLLDRPNRALGEYADLFDDQRIATFIADWATECGLEPEAMRKRVSRTLATAAHRNRTGGSVEAMLDVLRTMRSIPGYFDDR
ncbi:hypothetical protein SIM91_44535 [Rhodococcus opacus]|uniref:hypothetical protein n=1 Tax=Rhodococcus opacus TaxID=37919 RepID=UPI000AE93269|nr:hypothetical protein [Rhodococcus opacus]MDX5970206.1 hypothetical protein [Rhodococcus opacus]NKY75127.1 hypothetical protein [Rhodococcus opacus]CAG7632557.1 hypothetical protein E143388_07412 [Rhodococcus opacus]